MGGGSQQPIATCRRLSCEWRRGRGLDIAREHGSLVIGGMTGSNVSLKLSLPMICSYGEVVLVCPGSACPSLIFVAVTLSFFLPFGIFLHKASQLGGKNRKVLADDFLARGSSLPF
jgi:hypothetical protein